MLTRDSNRDYRPKASPCSVGFALALLALSLTGCGPPSHMTIQQGVDKGYIKITGVPHPSMDRANITVEFDSDRKSEVLIPAGIFLLASTSDIQDLITAAPIKVVFPGGTAPQIQTVSVEAYCMDRFLEDPGVVHDLPENSYAVALRAPVEGHHGRGKVVMDNIASLDQCLSRSNNPLARDHYNRQYALWLVTDGLANKSPDDLVSTFIQEAEPKIRQAVEAALPDVINRLEQQFPGYSRDYLEQQARASLSAQFHEAFQERVHEDVYGRYVKVRPLLDGCGYDTSTMTLFR